MNHDKRVVDKKDKHRRIKLWDAWQAQCEAKIAKQFETLRTAACQQFRSSAARFARLGKKDEESYDSLVALMDVYRAIVRSSHHPAALEPATHLMRGEPVLDACAPKNYGQDKGLVQPRNDIAIENPLFAGVCEVLASRLREFEDMQTVDGNPVTAEKNTIIERNLMTFCEKISAKHMADVDNHFRDCLKSCLAELDDLHSRKVARLYTDFITREWEELGNIIKVQVAAIEAEAGEVPIDALNMLREAYQQTGPVIGELHRLMKQTGSVRSRSLPLCGQVLPLQLAPPSPLNEPTASWKFPTDGENLHVFCGDGAFPSDNLFHTLLSAEAAALFSNTEHMKTAYQVQRLLSDDKFLAEGINSTFVSVKDALPTREEIKETLDQVLGDLTSAPPCHPEPEKGQCTQVHVSRPEKGQCAHAHVSRPEKGQCAQAHVSCPDPTLPQDTHLEILYGITETLEIKIESIAESIIIFDEEGQDLLRNFAGEKITPTEKELQLAIKTALDMWYNSPPECESWESANTTPEKALLEPLQDFFATLSTADVYTAHMSRIKKQTTSFLEKAEKLAFRFKKEVLLYEVCTYEEILIHSVSRLRESDWPAIGTAVKLLDNAYASLEILLKKSNIEAIRPAPHDTFNAFEHDILVAEKQDGFSKGEIIKMINTGYKQKDKTILRANVIAAK